jgi:hypothetical protein
VNNASVSEASSSQGKIGRWIAFLVFSLIFLSGGSIPALTNFPGVLARFTGVQTTASVSVEVGESCGDDGDSGNYFTYTFTDNRGKTQEITDNSACSSGIVSDGDQVTIWYEPYDPTHFISANQFQFDAIFVVGFSLPLLGFLAALLLSLLRWLRAAVNGGKTAFQ